MHMLIDDRFKFRMKNKTVECFTIQFLISKRCKKQKKKFQFKE